MLLYKVLSVLLEYPEAPLLENWNEIEQAIPELENASHADKQALRDFVVWPKQLSLTEFQEIYVKTFDLSPDNALYLTHHLVRRTRPRAWSDLGQSERIFQT